MFSRFNILYHVSEFFRLVIVCIHAFVGGVAHVEARGRFWEGGLLYQSLPYTFAKGITTEPEVRLVGNR